ncbi:MAG: hypothetical protein WCO56_29600, partial [Verrucomicrobiota bacterium]
MAKRLAGIKMAGKRLSSRRWELGGGRLQIQRLEPANHANQREWEMGNFCRNIYRQKNQTNADMAKRLAGSSRTEAHATLRSMFP